jgi:hypothetical protein
MIHTYGFLPQLLAATMQFQVNWARFITTMVVILGAIAAALYLEMRSSPSKKKK